MRQLSLTDTQTLVDSYVKTFGQRGAARKLTERGYRSPEGKPIQQGHISRVQAGSWTCFMAPEEPAAPAGAAAPAPRAGEPTETISAPVPEVTIAPRPLVEPCPEHYLERALSPPSLVAPSARGADCSVLQADAEEDLYEVRRQLRDELEAEEAARQEKEMNLPPLVPRPSDHTRAEHSHPQRFARPHAVFNRRQPIEIKTDEQGNEECFFGIPKLVHKSPATTSRPYQPKSYGQNFVSTRDLSAERRKDA